MTTQDEKYRRYVEIGETIGLFAKSLVAALAAVARSVIEWGKRYWQARNRDPQHWPH